MEINKLFDDEELAKKVEEALGDDLMVVKEENYVPKDRLNKEIEEKKNHKEMLDEYKSQVDELKNKIQDNEELEKEFNNMKQKFQEKEEEYQSKLARKEFENQLEKKVLKSGARNPTAVKALLSTGDLELNDGEIKGLDDQLESLKESDDYLFGDDTIAGREPNMDGDSASQKQITMDMIDEKDKQGDTKWFQEHEEEINKVMQGGE